MLNLFLLLKLSYSFTLHQECGLHLCCCVAGATTMLWSDCPQIKKKRERTRWQRIRWACCTSLSTDTSGTHLQTQKCMRNTSWEWTGGPDQWKRIYKLSHSLCLTLGNPMYYSPPGYSGRMLSVHGILQARTLEWVAISFSDTWKWKVKVKSLSRVPLFTTPWTAAHQAPLSMGFSRQEYWSGLPLPSPQPTLGSIT